MWEGGSVPAVVTAAETRVRPTGAGGTAVAVWFLLDFARLQPN